jgi:glycosyltransferase involved in cell wall biosynthesis
MQLERNHPEAEEGVVLPPLRLSRRALPPLAVRAFGQNVTLRVTADEYLRDDSYWRLRSIYEPALAAQTMAPTGTALDIGAGYGCFTIPFALANRGWTVWAFEPEAEAFAALCHNIAAHKVKNIIAVNAAVAGAVVGTDLAALRTALKAVATAGGGNALAMTALQDRLPTRDFRRHTEMRGVIELGPVIPEIFEACAFPTLPAEALLSLEPQFLKLTAPMAEVGILEDLTSAPLDHVIGESWAHIPSQLVYGRSRGLRQTWIPRAGDPVLRLRRVTSLNGHRPGLDIVVAMYNSRKWIRELVDSLLEDGNPEIRALVVDDGSTDGSGAFVAETYAGDDRVVVLSKENGGCASARNFGRLNSDATHIAFVDADDVAGPGLFDGLLDLARQTGAELVQGGFEAFDADADGKPIRIPSYETDLPDLLHAHRHPFGDRTVILAPSWLLTEGQPSIWRRVYRRDFLDNQNIWFPEHIRAFDDQIFQLLTLQKVSDVPMLEGVHYLYRQHPAQDIRQGDERNFYSLEMFRMVLKRGITEGWNDFRPTLSSFVRTVNWCWSHLRPDLRPAFERGAAELWAYAHGALEASAFEELGDDQFAPPDFAYHVRTFRARLRVLDGSYGGVYLDSIDMHPTMLRRAEGASLKK